MYRRDIGSLVNLHKRNRTEIPRSVEKKKKRKKIRKSKEKKTSGIRSLPSLKTDGSSGYENKNTNDNYTV